jgi:hypothetical protein
VNKKHALTLGTAGLALAFAATQAFTQGAPAGAHILIICGDENGNYEDCTSLDDRSLELHIRLDLGHRVTMMSDNTEPAEMMAAADAADLVIVPESVISNGVSTTLTTTTTPIINMEAFLQDEFGFVNPEAGTLDPGPPTGWTVDHMEDAWDLLDGIGIRLDVEYELPPAPAGADAEAIAAIAEDAYEAAVEAAIEAGVAAAEQPGFGAILGETDIIITDPSHPLAAGLSGRVTVYTLPAEINWARTEVLAPGVQTVARLPDYDDAQSIYFILPGDALFDGTPSPNLRISLFTENHNDLGTYHRMTEDGHRLFDAAINWALTYGSGM